MHIGIDVLENEIIDKYPKVLNTLLFDRTTQKNIFWATDNYEHLGVNYKYDALILPEYITGDNGNVIMPRVKKDKVLQQSRARSMAEVFTPSWVCNAQNNLIDANWFGRRNVFNYESKNDAGGKGWKVNFDKITFPKGKAWEHYIKSIRLEIACGEAPYLTSRYDTTTGTFIPVAERIGIIDRKLRIINENVDSSGEWLIAAQTAYKTTYGYEWQGDSLLLAREALLYTFIENYYIKFGKEPASRSINYIASIISWNIWQMDGIKGVIPGSCSKSENVTENLFGQNDTQFIECLGCRNNDIRSHNGDYCIIKDWLLKKYGTGLKGKIIRYVDLLKK